MSAALNLTSSSGDSGSVMSSPPPFDKLQLPISHFILDQPLCEQWLLYPYLSELDDVERIAYVVAHEELGESHNVVACNGFLKFKAERMSR
jgi:hypothetical protein